MIVVLTGAFKNVGDHLIGDRAIRLLREFCDNEIINLNRLNLKEADYQTMNKARAVILCGGPAYQKNMYPNVYPLDLSKLKTKVIPFGIGWKGTLDQTTDSFAFSEDSIRFIKEVHKTINESSCRDFFTVEVLDKLNVKNVCMTGCPAWYDIDKISSDLKVNEVKKILVSDPANIKISTFKALKLIKKEFPKANIEITLHHGFYPRISLGSLKFFTLHLIFVTYGLFNNVKFVNFSANLDKMKQHYSNTDLHIGYRVHAHIYCLSQRVPSLLISEDSRGVGQSIALGAPVIRDNDDNFLSNLQSNLQKIKTEREAFFQETITIMRTTFEKMKNFLTSI